MNEVHVLRFGECLLSEEPAVIKCNGVGNCVVAYIFDDDSNLFSCCFVLLESPPVVAEFNAYNARYGSIAISHSLNFLREKGCKAIKAKIFGGSNIKILGGSTSNFIKTGDNLSGFVKKLLVDAGVEIVAEDIGGYSGRCILIQTSDRVAHVNKADGSSYSI